MLLTMQLFCGHSETETMNGGSLMMDEFKWNTKMPIERQNNNNKNVWGKCMLRSKNMKVKAAKKKYNKVTFTSMSVQMAKTKMCKFCMFTDICTFPYMINRVKTTDAGRNSIRNQCCKKKSKHMHRRTNMTLFLCMCMFACKQVTEWWCIAVNTTTVD